MGKEPSLAFWEFHCPECHFGHAEHGHLLGAHDVYCMVCLEENDQFILLYRWQAVEFDEPASKEPKVSLSGILCEGSY